MIYLFNCEAEKKSEMGRGGEKAGPLRKNNLIFLFPIFYFIDFRILLNYVALVVGPLKTKEKKSASPTKDEISPRQFGSGFLI